MGGRGSQDVRKGIRIERKPLKTAKKCRKNIAVVLCLLRRSFCVRFLGLTHTLTHTANVQRAAERMIVSSSPPLSTFLHDLRHEIAHLFCCTFLHLARDVRVSAEREARIEVSEHTRYGFHVHAVLQCQGRECVPLRYNYDKPEKPRISRLNSDKVLFSFARGIERCDRNGHAVFLRPGVDFATTGSEITGISTSSTKLK